MRLIIGLLAPFCCSKERIQLVTDKIDELASNAYAFVTGGHIGLESIAARHIANTYPKIRNIVLVPGQINDLNKDLAHLPNGEWIPSKRRGGVKIWCEDFLNMCDEFHVFMVNRKDYPGRYVQPMAKSPKLASTIWLKK